MPLRTSRSILLSLALCLLASPAARADVATSISSELTANGVSSPTVTVSTPAPASTADVAAFEADPSQSYPSITPENLLSTDPTNPQPIVTVNFAPPGPAHPLPGTVTAPGDPGAYVEDAQTPIWEASIMEAVKHAIASGATLTGVVAYGPPFPGRDTTQPDVYAPTPDPATFDPASSPQTITTGAVQMQFQLGLPQQYGGATVTVADAAGGQRTVTIAYDQPAAAFANDNLSALTDYADTLQAQLDDPLQGGNIGEVVVTSKDPSTQSPLFTHAADATWGQKFEWSAPSVKAYTDPSAPASS